MSVALLLWGVGACIGLFFFLRWTRSLPPLTQEQEGALDTRLAQEAEEGVDIFAGYL